MRRLFLIPLDLFVDWLAKFRVVEWLNRHSTGFELDERLDSSETQIQWITQCPRAKEGAATTSIRFAE
jgi:hypothetical protein